MTPHVCSLRFRRQCLAGALVAWSSLAGLRAEPPAPLADFVSQMWTAEDGLPHNRVNSILQDHAGFLWFATYSGLTRFDGRTFKDFPVPAASQKSGGNIRGIVVESPTSFLVLPAGDEVLRLENGVFQPHPISAALAGHGVADIFVEPGGVLWVGTTTGRLFRWEAGAIQSFGPEDGIDRRAPVFSFAIDKEGRTWVGTGMFFGYYEGGRLVPFPEPQGRVVTIAPARDGGVWVLASGQLKKLANGMLTTIAADPPWLRLNASVRNFVEDREGRLWFAATRHGIFWYANGQFTQAPFLATTIYDMQQDREGNMWVATEGDGVGIVRKQRFLLFDQAVGLRQKLSLSVCEDETGVMWFANGPGGLFRMEGGLMERMREFVPNIHANRVIADGRGYLWVAAGDGLYRLSTHGSARPEKISQPIRFIAALFTAGNGDLWIAGANREGLGYVRDGVFHPVSPLDPPAATVIAEDRQGTILIGSESGELLAFRGGTLQPFREQKGRPMARIHSLFVDKIGVIWMGTADGLFLIGGGRYHRMSGADGLRDHVIFQILEDDLGYFWFGSRRGYFRVARHELMARAEGRLQRVNSLAFGKDEGLPGVLPVSETQPSAWKDHRGHLWFTTFQGVISVDPAAFTQPAQPVTVLIDEARLGQQLVDVTRQITVPPGPHRLEFRFAAPSSTPANVRFRHRMEGFDRDWNETEAGQSAVYSNMPPGRYRIQVIACDGSGRWNQQGATQEVTVIPSWWQRTGVRVGAGLALLAAVTLLIRYTSQVKLRRRLARIEEERALDRERTRIARDVHDELGSGVTGVRFLVSRLKSGASKATADRVVEQLTRQTQQLAFDLERVVWTVHPKSNSLDQLATFIGRFAQNLLQGGEVQCAIRRETDIPPHRMTPETQHHVLAVAKEALNNVLKHSSASDVVIETSYRGGVFSLAIRDDGTGFHPDAPEHSERNGLSNMRSRTEEMGGRIEITSSPGDGTSVQLFIPVKSATDLPALSPV